MSSHHLPQLPGYRFSDPKKQRHSRSNTFQSRNGYILPRISGAAERDDGVLPEEQLRDLSLAATRLTYRTTSGDTAARAAPKTVAPPHVPAHVALDKKTLTFHGYFKETVHESPDEHFRVRHVKIFYHLEDDTMSVLEPEVANSGLPQGKLIRRQRLPKDASGNFYLWKDLNTAQNISIYGKVFRITKCDPFTKRFLESNGIEVRPFEEAPADPYTVARRQAEQPGTLAQAPNDFDKLRQFLTLDRKVLRFYCIWDDRESLHGEKRHFTLLYFLVDDTVEIRERHTANNGRDSFPILLRRQRVPRNHKAVKAPNFPSIVLELSDEELKDTIGPEDLGIGQLLNVLGRHFLLYDCDEFTKEFYRRNFNVQDFTPLDVDEPATERAAPQLPPHTGFGSHEDSMQSVLALQPKPPRGDINKLLAYDNQALRFVAKMDSEDDIDEERSFVISYFLASDTISIYESKSAYTSRGQRFLEASRIRHHDATSDNVFYYSEGDLYPGARLVVHSRTFVLGECDRHVAKYAKAHPEKYAPEARDAILRQHDMADEGQGQASANFAEAETYDDEQPVEDYDEEADALRDIVMSSLAEAQFNQYDVLHKKLLENDPNREGVQPADLVVDAVVESGVPLERDIVEQVVARCAMGDGNADYNQLLAMLGQQ